MICDGQHAMPMCDDPCCWHGGDSMRTSLVGTLAWQAIRNKVLTVVSMDQNLEVKSQLLAFMAEHWQLQVPRQQEFAALEQKIRRLERQVEYLKGITRDYDKRSIDD